MAAKSSSTAAPLVKDDSGRVLYWVRWAATYWGVDCDRGQVLAAAPMHDDNKLLRLKYLVPVSPTDQPTPCRNCGERFIDLSLLNAHGDKRHSKKAKRPDVSVGPRGATVDDTAAQTQALEKEQRRNAQEAPLDLEQTAASRGVHA